MAERKIPVYMSPKELIADVSFQRDNDSRLFGVKPIASLDARKLRGLALEVWKTDDRIRFIDFIVVQEVKELDVDGKIVYYAASGAYIGR